MQNYIFKTYYLKENNIKIDFYKEGLDCVLERKIGLAERI
jgi:hypothetical protein